MRFAIVKNRLIPQILLSAAENTVPISQMDIPPQPARNTEFPFNEGLQQQLAGKQLLLEELPFDLQDIQTHYENGYLVYRKGIEFENQKAKCVRCGNREPHLFASFPCARCGEVCLYCRKCIMMGRVSACSPLISWIGPEPKAVEKLPVKECLQPPAQAGWTQQPEMEQILSTISRSMNRNKQGFCNSNNGEEMKLDGEGASYTPFTSIDLFYNQEEGLDEPLENEELHEGHRLLDGHQHPLKGQDDASHFLSESHIKLDSYPAMNPSSHPCHSAIPTQRVSLLQWNGKLSPGQRQASDRVAEAISQSQSLLVWAVCGAGKTEVLFQGMNRALMEGKRVCIATPRTDVVLELAPRLQKVFPAIRSAVLYGGSEDRHLNAPLTIATTHQLLRFYQAFDTMIVDEVDAFPFSAEETLQYAVEQARKPTSSVIFLTATPTESLQKECRKGTRSFVTIPARFHRYALPVPRFVWCGHWRKLLKKGMLPPNVLQWLKQLIATEKQALLFFPRIELMEQLLPILKKLHPNIESVHAEDPQRKEKVQAMRQREIPILLTTTILERGVTFPNLDVAVLGAEDNIFTESALVQIAGRVGRSPYYPTGDIAFFHYGKTEAMVKARKQIINMNKEAERKGMIDH
nr:DEAD/DEAH box helicase [uncultured Bacillus sp.]